MAAISQVPVLDLNIDKVESGIPLEELSRFVAESGLRFADIHEVVLPARTLKHRKARNEPLNVDESDKLARLARVYEQTVAVFGTREKACRWLSKPKKRFEGRTPIQMLRTEIGGLAVTQMLGQIEHGMFA